MIRLDTTTRKLQALLGGSITTNQLPVTVCYSDKTSTAYTGGTTVINTNNTTAVDICAAPAASTVRDVDTINVNNADTVAATITIRYNDNGTTYTLFKATLAVGDQLTYVHGVGWNVIDSTGKTKVGAGVNGPSSSTDNALARWDGTTGTAIQDSGWTLDDSNALAMGGAISNASNFAANFGTGALTAGTITGSSTFNITGTGPHAIGGATNAGIQWYQRGTFSPSGGGTGTGFFLGPTVNIEANTSGMGMRLSPTLVEAGSGTHPILTALYVAPSITAGSANVTEYAGIYIPATTVQSTTTTATSLYIAGAPSGGATNYALWVDAGTIRFDGTTGAGANTGTLTNAPSTGNPAYWMPVNANGTTYYIPCWT